MADSGAAKWSYAAALPLTIFCLALGNILGIILTALWGWESVQQEQPGSVAVAFVQGYLGALVAMAASDHFLKTAKPADFWIKWLVRILGAGYVAILVALVVIRGDTDFVFRWATLAAGIDLVGTELGRRVYDRV